MPHGRQAKSPRIRPVTNLGLWRDALSELARKLQRLIFRGLPPKPSLGERGERLAEEFLLKQGWRLLTRQFRAAPGEIDLIMEDGATVVFVEVKTRTSSRYGSPFEAVDEAKQRHIVQTALCYLKQQGLLERRSRFDIVSIVWPDEHAGQPTIEHFADAFRPTGQGQFFS
jgi:putative endonuclease